MRRAAGLVLAAALLGACATVERIVPIPVLWPPGGPSSSALSEDLVDYIARARGMNEAALAAEATRARQAATKDAGDLARVKAGIAVSLLPQADEAEILALVEPVAKRDAPAPVKAMASFLQAQALERRRLRESAASARATLRDERRALETQKQRADALQERATALQQKLDALVELEKSLSDRQSPNPR
jgi:hypothetical protein